MSTPRITTAHLQAIIFLKGEIMSTPRITTAHLQAIISCINSLTNSPQTPFAAGPDGQYVPQANCYHLSQAYGGYALHRMVSDGGSGIHDVLSMGHIPKRELADLMKAYIRGLEQR